MTDLSFSFPPAMLNWLEQRVAQGDYVDVGDYLRDLVRREQEEARETEWLREQIAATVYSGTEQCDPKRAPGGSTLLPRTFEGKAIAPDTSVAAILQPYMDRVAAIVRTYVSFSISDFRLQTSRILHQHQWSNG